MKSHLFSRIPLANVRTCASIYFINIISDLQAARTLYLIIQIPCFNEEKTLPQVIADFPKKIPDVDKIEYLIINDGSSDKTVEVAQKCGVHHIVQVKSNRGLANAFRLGLEASLKLGADVIVNTDGDNQYDGRDIETIVRPVVEGESDLVVGCRPITQIQEFSFIKKMLQLLGSFVLRRLSGTKIPDATSGFRAYSREAATRLVVTDTYTYTLETLIQAGTTAEIKVGHVLIRCNPQTRKSRLITSIPMYVARSAMTIIKMFIFYRPFRFFLSLSSVFFVMGLSLGIRYLLLNYIFITAGKTYIPSLILSAICLSIGVVLLVTGFLGLLHGISRKINLENVYLLRKSYYATFQQK